MQSPIIHHVLLKGLNPGTKYFYTVGKLPPCCSPWCCSLCVPSILWDFLSTRVESCESRLALGPMGLQIKLAKIIDVLRAPP